MTDLRAYADIEAVIRVWLKREFADLDLSDEHFGTDWPAPDVVPFFRFERTAMSRRTKLIDAPVVDIEALGVGKGGERGAKSLMSRVEEAILGYPLSVVVDGRTVVLDSATIPVSFRELDWNAQNVRRFAGTYQFTVRR